MIQSIRTNNYPKNSLALDSFAAHDPPQRRTDDPNSSARSLSNERAYGCPRPLVPVYHMPAILEPLHISVPALLDLLRQAWRHATKLVR